MLKDVGWSTLIVADPLTPPATVARMVAWPEDTAATRPDEEIVALGLSDVQVTGPA
jgi:hypothetical protein